MLRSSLLVCWLSLGAAGPALALGSNSTMAEWRAASPEDREALLETMGPRLSRSFQAAKVAIMACLDLASQAPGHASVPVSDIAKACVEAAEPDRKSPSTDI